MTESPHEDEDTEDTEDTVGSLEVSLSPNDKNKKHSFIKSPNLRRHFSEPAIDLAKLFENVDDENKEIEDKNDIIKSSIDLSAFSIKDSIKFSDELKKMIESLKFRKDLPPKSVINGLLNVIEIWINDHGIKAINELNEEIDKYQQLELRYSKERDILNQTIEEYKNEYHEYQNRRESFDNNKEEMQTKLNDATEKLQTFAFLESQILELREELDTKSLEHEKSLSQAIQQQRTINQLKEEKMQLQKIIDQQKIKLSNRTQIDNELKNRLNEIREIKNDKKELQRKLDIVHQEKMRLFDDKKTMQTKVTDYSKLQDNLSQYKENEKDYQKRIEIYKQKNKQLIEQINDLKQINKDINFIHFKDQVYTYNMTKTVNNNNILFDETDLETMRQEFGSKSSLSLHSPWKNNKNNNNNNNKRQFTSNIVYRSFVIIGICSFAYLVWSQYYQGTSLQKAKQIRDKYNKWQNQIAMKKRMVEKQSSLRKG